MLLSIIKLIVLFCFFSLFAYAQELKLLAHYPLESSGVDITGNLPAMKIFNTTFVDGGIYCNGIYAALESDLNASHVETPPLPESFFKKFSISVKFKVYDIPKHNPYPWNENPIIIGGMGWRWIGCYLTEDTTVAFLYNNSNESHTTAHYSFNTWHEITISYDDATKSSELYFDNELINKTTFDMDRGKYDWDNTFSTKNYSRGQAFLGVIKDLKLYSYDPASSSVSDGFNINQHNQLASWSYPNPFSTATDIHFELPVSSNVAISIYNSLGMKITNLFQGFLENGKHKVVWDSADLPMGVYNCNISYDNYSSNIMLIVIR